VRGSSCDGQHRHRHTVWRCRWRSDSSRGPEGHRHLCLCARCRRSCWRNRWSTTGDGVAVACLPAGHGAAIAGGRWWVNARQARDGRFDRVARFSLAFRDHNGRRWRHVPGLCRCGAVFQRASPTEFNRGATGILSKGAQQGVLSKALSKESSARRSARRAQQGELSKESSAGRAQQGELSKSSHQCSAGRAPQALRCATATCVLSRERCARPTGRG
jgi:hypothetical protein